MRKIDLFGISTLYLLASSPVHARFGAKESVRFLETPYLSGLSDSWQIIVGGLIGVGLIVLWVAHARSTGVWGLKKNRHTEKKETV